MKQFIWTLFSVMVGMIGYTIHNSVFWAIIDWAFSPIVVLKWLIYHEITISIIQSTFSFLF